jgi:hypothetical protein
VYTPNVYPTYRHTRLQRIGNVQVIWEALLPVATQVRAFRTAWLESKSCDCVLPSRCRSTAQRIFHTHAIGIYRKNLRHGVEPDSTPIPQGNPVKFYRHSTGDPAGWLICLQGSLSNGCSPPHTQRMTTPRLPPEKPVDSLTYLLFYRGASPVGSNLECND